MVRLLGLLAAAAALPLALAHGESSAPGALQRRQEHVQHARRAVDNCAATLKARDLERRTTRRAEFIKRTYGSAAPALARRQADATDPYNATVPNCVLAPEEEVGPYYLAGELIREDVREDEPGVDMLLDVQVFDVSTCEVLSGVYLDIWSCNTTGVYSGYDAEGTLGLTYLRGLQESDDSGIVQFQTKFPGHYGGRATHLHLVAHIDGTVLDNGTYTSGTIPHIGQVFFPQDMITTIEATSPYDQNTVSITLNEDDRVYTGQANITAGYTDIVDIEMLGDSLDDGLLGYISVGLDLTANYSTGGGGGGGGGPGGSPPS